MGTVSANLSAYPDEDLVAELKARGFMVIRRAHVRTASAEIHANKRYLLQANAGDYLGFLKRDAAVSIGDLLLKEGLPFVETRRDPAGVGYRATLTWLAGPPADPMSPEYPLYADPRP